MSKSEVVLEIKKDNSDGSTFYRYRFRNTKFWFDETKNGAIYCVYIVSDCNDDVEFYLDCRCDGTLVCRPTKTRFRFRNTFISADDVDVFIKTVEEAKLVASTIDAFFEGR